MDWVVGLVGVQLDEFGYSSGFTNFAEFLEVGFEALRLRKGHRVGFGVGVMEHCYPQDVRKWIGINGGWVVSVMARIHGNMDSAILVLAV